MNNKKKQQKIKIINEILLQNFAKNIGITKNRKDLFISANEKWGRSDVYRSNKKINWRLNLRIKDFLKIFIGILIGFSTTFMIPIQQGVRGVADQTIHNQKDTENSAKLSFTKVSVSTKFVRTMVNTIINYCIEDNLKFEVEPQDNSITIKIYKLEKFKHESIKLQINEIDQSFAGNLLIEVNQE